LIAQRDEMSAAASAASAARGAGGGGDGGDDLYREPTDLEIAEDEVERELRQRELALGADGLVGDARRQRVQSVARLRVAEWRAREFRTHLERAGPLPDALYFLAAERVRVDEIMQPVLALQQRLLRGEGELLPGAAEAFATLLNNYESFVSLSVTQLRERGAAPQPPRSAEEAECSVCDALLELAHTLHALPKCNLDLPAPAFPRERRSGRLPAPLRDARRFWCLYVGPFTLECSLERFRAQWFAALRVEHERAAQEHARAPAREARPPAVVVYDVVQCIVEHVLALPHAREATVTAAEGFLEFAYRFQPFSDAYAAARLFLDLNPAALQLSQWPTRGPLLRWVQPHKWFQRVQRQQADALLLEQGIQRAQLEAAGERERAQKLLHFIVRPGRLPAQSFEPPAAAAGAEPEGWAYALSFAVLHDGEPRVKSTRIVVAGPARYGDEGSLLNERTPFHAVLGMLRRLGWQFAITELEEAATMWGEFDAVFATLPIPAEDAATALIAQALGVLAQVQPQPQPPQPPAQPQPQAQQAPAGSPFQPPQPQQPPPQPLHQGYPLLCSGSQDKQGLSANEADDKFAATAFRMRPALVQVDDFAAALAAGYAPPAAGAGATSVAKDLVSAAFAEAPAAAGNASALTIKLTPDRSGPSLRVWQHVGGSACMRARLATLWALSRTREACRRVTELTAVLRGDVRVSPESVFAAALQQRTATALGTFVYHAAQFVAELPATAIAQQRAELRALLQSGEGCKQLMAMAAAAEALAQAVASEGPRLSSAQVSAEREVVASALEALAGAGLVQFKEQTLPPATAFDLREEGGSAAQHTLFWVQCFGLRASVPADEFAATAEAYQMARFGEPRLVAGWHRFVTDTFVTLDGGGQVTFAALRLFVFRFGALSTAFTRAKAASAANLAAAGKEVPEHLRYLFPEDAARGPAAYCSPLFANVSRDRAEALLRERNEKRAVVRGMALKGLTRMLVRPGRWHDTDEKERWPLSLSFSPDERSVSHSKILRDGAFFIVQDAPTPAASWSEALRDTMAEAKYDTELQLLNDIESLWRLLLDRAHKKERADQEEMDAARRRLADRLFALEPAE
jgi:hypothetical protein